MSRIIYRIVEHAGGWAYQADGTYSETFATHDEALNAAKRVVREQAQPGRDVGISFEDASGKWHEELANGNDRPEAIAEG